MSLWYFLFVFFFVMIRRPPRSTRTDTLSLHDALPIYAVIGQVLGLEVVIAQGQPGRLLHTQTDGGREAELGDVDLVATGHIGVVGHRVDTEGSVGIDDAVDVDGGALGQVSTQRHAAGVEILALGGLGDQVDGAAGAAAATEGRADR